VPASDIDGDCGVSAEEFKEDGEEGREALPVATTGEIRDQRQSGRRKGEGFMGVGQLSD
jgi:hypothetical protein